MPASTDTPNEGASPDASSRPGASEGAPGDTLRRFITWLSTPTGIVTLFVLGLLIRLLLAGTQGFPYDMSSFRGWASRLAERGPWDFYPTQGEQYFVDYPPGYLYVLWILGVASDLIVGGSPPTYVIKLPPILADLALAWLVMLASARLAPPAIARRAWLRPLAASVILLNPAIFFVSAVWGQADSVPAVLVVGAFVLLGTGGRSLRREAAGMALLSFAIGTKPQASFVLPMVGLLLLWRHVRAGVEEADDPRSRRRGAWLGVRRVALLGATGVAAGFLMFLPFRLYPTRALEFYASSAGQYEVTSVFAFNLWGAVGFWRPDSGPDAVELFGLPVLVWGLALFVVAAALVLARAYASLRGGSDEGRVLVFGSMALTLVGFAVLTRIHERYLFLPLALGAMLVGYSWLRRALAALSLLYLINVFFPYVYYLGQEDLPAPKLGGLFDALYGSDIGGVRMRLLCVVTTLACGVVAWRGWRGLEKTPQVTEADETPAGPIEAGVLPVRPPWSLHLHAIPRRPALIAFAVLAVAFISRLAGLGHPPGMYFDEVYHARAGAEYLAGKEIFEYTHPPFAKEVMGFSIQHLSGFGTHSGLRLPAGVRPSMIAPSRSGVVWASTTGDDATVSSGRIDPSCELESSRTVVSSDIRPEVVAATPSAVLLGGVATSGPVVTRLEGASEVWRASISGRPAAMATVGERAYVVTADGSLVTVDKEGEPKDLAIGARDISASVEQDEAWVTFPDQERIASWDAEGDRDKVIETGGTPGAIAAPDDAERAYVSVGDEILSFDTENESIHSRVPGAAQLLGTVPEATTVWAVDGTSLRIIEPHSGSVIGRTSFDRPPARIIGEPFRHQLIGLSDESAECASGRPQFAWRLPSAVTGALMVLFVFLLALRLTGNLWVGLLAAFFVNVDGLTFTISRIAMNDSFTAAFLLGAWFTALSALRAWGRGRTADASAPVPRDRSMSIVWLAATGVLGGLGLASKWPALYALGAIGLLMLWDGFARKEDSIWRVAGGFVPGAVVVIGTLVVLPVSIYILTYTPYFALGHSFGDWLRLQESMFSYHAGLTATHPFGSPWYGWPFGYRAVYLYLASWGSERSEIWSIPNLVVIIGGAIAMAFLAREVYRRRSAALGIVLFGAAVQYLPWVAVSRVTFMYHYLPAVPFLAIALAWLLVQGLEDRPYRKALAIGTTVGAAAFFLLLYPILVGWRMPNGYGDAVRAILPWVI